MRVARCFVLAGIAVGAIGSGCDCGGGQEPQIGGQASLVARFPGGSSVQSDGVSRLQISLSAIGKDRKPDTKAITVTVPAGQGSLAPRDGDIVAGDSLTADPSAQGALDLDFICTQDANAGVVLTATNGDASASITVTCVPPQGDVVVTINTNACNAIQGDGASVCDIEIDASQTSQGVTIPFDKALAVSATAVADGVNPQTNVLSQTGAAQGTANINVTPTDGVAHLDFHAPSVAETATVTVATGNASFSADIIVRAFVNQATLTLTLDKTSIKGGSPDTLTVIGNDSDGTPAAGAVVSLTINSTAASFGGNATLDVTLDGSGQATADIATTAVTDVTNAVIDGTFQPSIGPAKTDEATLVVNPPGQLTLNLSNDPLTLLSTGNAAQRTTTVTVSLTKDDAAVSGGSVQLTIPASSTGFIRFATGDPAAQTISTFDGNGEATVDVVCQDGDPVPTSNADLIGTGSDGAGGTADAELTIHIDRGPILQNIEFVSVVPDAALGVLGSSLPSTAQVTFRLTDDRGQPLPNVPVTFSKNVSADPAITVQPEDTSAADGTVSTTLSAGTNPGPVTVIATAVAARDSDGNPVIRVGTSSPIAIVSGLPSFETSFLVCDQTAVSVPWTASCTAELVDRFTNTVDGLIVQFNAEAGNEAAAETTQGGAATVSVGSNNFLDPRTDVSSWSYAPILPQSESELQTAATGNPFTVADAQACFDDTITTPCNLIALCNDPGTAAFCPLIPDGLVDATDAASILLSPPTAQDVANDTTGTGARAVIRTYIAEHRAGGFPVSCLTGVSGGISFVDGDDCPANLGCFDFTGVTTCPQDGLRTIMASTRGAEAFSDTNGNGVFDFDDRNSNGRMDEGEPVLGDAFVDLPEPFLDVNDNCVRDDFTNAVRFENTPIEKVANTDKFLDVDGQGVFGFPTLAGTTRTNKVWDADTQNLPHHPRPRGRQRLRRDRRGVHRDPGNQPQLRRGRRHYRRVHGDRRRPEDRAVPAAEPQRDRLVRAVLSLLGWERELPEPGLHRARLRHARGPGGEGRRRRRRRRGRRRVRLRRPREPHLARVQVDARAARARVQGDPRRRLRERHRQPAQHRHGASGRAGADRLVHRAVQLNDAGAPSRRVTS